MRPIRPTHKLTQILAAALVALSLLPVAWGGAKYKALHSFGAGKDGTYPAGPLVLDGKGRLYGMTRGGGTGRCSDYGCGTVFELALRAGGRWREVVLHNFSAGSDGSRPNGGLIVDGTGNLYGTIEGDGNIAVGGVIKLSPGAEGWTNTVLYSGNAGPGVVSDKLGNLYGEMGRGQYKYGAIAELSPNSNGWTYTPLYSFCVFQCGYAPPAPPIWDGKGNLFGTTTNGGISQPACWTSFGCGVIFEMTPNHDGSWTYHILHRFASYSTDGQSPDAGLVMDAAGNFYGSTALGGAHNQGTLFKFAFTGGHWKKTVLYDFPNCKIGCYPGFNMALGAAGNLYGVTGSGGLPGCGGYYCGVVYQLIPRKTGKWKYSVLHEFNGVDGGFPNGVIIDGKGTLYGTTSAFGAYNAGVAFEITP
jgi:uncharacterized repeat protein (TIGR03803 family)